VISSTEFNIGINRRPISPRNLRQTANFRDEKLGVEEEIFGGNL